MKKRIILIIWILSLIVGSIEAQVVVSSDLFRHIYLGIENPISIMIKDVPDHQMGISVNQGSLRKIGPNKYTWTVCSSDKTHLFLKVYKERTLVDSIGFKLIPLPDPSLSTTTQDGEIIFKDIKAINGVRAELENFIVEGISCQIQKFTITIEKKDGTIVKLENHGSPYEKATMDEFSLLEIGETVIVSDFFVAVGCEPEVRKLKTILKQVYTGKKYQYRH